MLPATFLVVTTPGIWDIGPCQRETPGTAKFWTLRAASRKQQRKTQSAERLRFEREAFISPQTLNPKLRKPYTVNPKKQGSKASFEGPCVEDNLLLLPSGKIDRLEQEAFKSSNPKP